MSTTAVPALDKTFQILDLITDSTQPLTAAHIAKTLNLPRSSTHNILQSLLAKHVIYKDSDSRFHLGSYLMYWAGKYEQQHRVIQLFHELITHFPSLLQHTVTLSKIDGTEVVFLACHESPAPLGFTFHAGVRVPAAFSATGKAMLATYSDQSLMQMFANNMPAPLTPYGVTTLEALMTELRQIRQSNISLDNGQLREGMYCLGTCIRDNNGEAIAGMAVSFLQQEYQRQQQNVSESLLALASQMTQKLGIKSK